MDSHTWKRRSFNFVFSCLNTAKIPVLEKKVILKDSSLNSIFICFETVINNDTQKFIFTNEELRYNLCFQKIIDCKEPKHYEDAFHKYLSNKNYSLIENKTFLKDRNIILDSFVLEKQQKGKAYFINFFFKKGVLRKGFFKYKDSIIWCLWNWCFFTRIDGYSGNLVITKVNKNTTFDY